MSLAVQLKEKQDEYGKLVADARAIYDSAKTENRSVTAEENHRFDEIMGRADADEVEIGKINRLIEAEKRSLEHHASAGRVTDPGQAGSPSPAGNARPFAAPGTDGAALINSPAWQRRSTPEYRSMFGAYIRGGYAEFGPTETRALQADSDIAGGFLVMPMQVVNNIIVALKDAVLMRRLGTVLPPLTAAQSLGIPTIDTDVSDPDWTAEIKTATEDTALGFGGRELNPHPLSKLAKVSAKLLRLAGNAEGIVQDRLSYKFGVAEEKGFMLGTGAGQPLGIYVASDQGISTARDVSTDNTTTQVTANGLINATYSLKAGYLAKSQWIFHRLVLREIRKLTDGNGQYLWQPGLQGGQPNTILDRPVNMSEFAPSTMTTGKYVGILGDFSYYHIVDSLNYAVQRLVELFALTNQIGFIGRKETDGMPVLEEAFTRVQLA